MCRAAIRGIDETEPIDLPGLHGTQRHLVRRSPVAFIRLSTDAELSAAVSKQSIALLIILSEHPRAVDLRIFQADEQRSTGKLRRRSRDTADVIILAAFGNKQRSIQLM